MIYSFFPFLFAEIRIVTLEIKIPRYIFLIYRKLTAEKTVEKDALDESVKQVRSKTTSHINDMHTVVDDKIKTMAWNSHARQTKVRLLEVAPNYFNPLSICT